jgi:hypothetical protein
MRAKEAKRFIIAMIEAGSNAQAIGTTGYVIAEPVDLDDLDAYSRIEAVSKRFPDRASMKQDIIACLREMGRFEE